MACVSVRRDHASDSQKVFCHITYWLRRASLRSLLCCTCALVPGRLTDLCKHGPLAFSAPVLKPRLNSKLAIKIINWTTDAVLFDLPVLLRDRHRIFVAV